MFEGQSPSRAGADRQRRAEPARSRKAKERTGKPLGRGDGENYNAENRRGVTNAGERKAETARGLLAGLKPAGARRGSAFRSLEIAVAIWEKPGHGCPGFWVGGNSWSLACMDARQRRRTRRHLFALCSRSQSYDSVLVKMINCPSWIANSSAMSSCMVESIHLVTASFFAVWRYCEQTKAAFLKVRQKRVGSGCMVDSFLGIG